MELIMIGLMAAGVILFPLGGTDIGGKGYKWIRRFVLPFVLAGLVLLSGVIWWKCLIIMVGLSVAFHMGYGHKKPYWYKAIVFTLYALPTVALGFTVWQIITPLACLGIMRLSNSQLSSQFPWKICEGFMGFLIGVTLSVLI